MMSLLAFFQTVWSSNVLLYLITFYLVLSIFYSAHTGSCHYLDKPVLFKSFNLFSSLFVCLVFYLYCFDFHNYNTLFLFNQNIQMLFMLIMLFVLLCKQLDTDVSWKRSMSYAMSFPFWTSFCTAGYITFQGTSFLSWHVVSFSGEWHNVRILHP